MFLFRTGAPRTCPRHFLRYFRPNRQLLRHYSEAPASRTENFEELLLEDRKEDYLRVNVGNIITSDEGKKYEAMRKLGWGTNSTVWIGRDLDEKAAPRYVAVKILTKSATEASSRISGSEIDILQRARAGVEPPHRPRGPSYMEQKLPGPPHPGWRRISGLRGVYTCDNSQHLILVSPLYGEHMRDYMANEPEKRLTEPYVKVVAQQTLLALDYLHRLCGIIHCDVKPENILRDFNIGANIDDLFEVIMEQEPDAGKDGRTTPLWFPHTFEPEIFFVVLSDFSHATWSDLIQRSTRAIGSPALKAPELVLGFAYGTEIDIWSFGCTIFELLTGKALFRFPDGDLRNPNDLADEPNYHLSLMQRIIGEPFSPRASTALLTGKGLVSDDGWVKSPSDIESLTLEERIVRDGPKDMEDRDEFVTFLRRCLRLNSKDRATAKELLDDPWLAENASAKRQQRCL